MCCGLNACILLKSIVGNPNPECDGTGWGFGRWFGHERGGLMNGINDLVKETPASSLALSAMKTQQEDGCVLTRKLSPDTESCSIASWTCQPLELWVTNAGYVSCHIWYSCYSSWNGLKRCGTKRKSRSLWLCTVQTLCTQLEGEGVKGWASIFSGLGCTQGLLMVMWRGFKFNTGREVAEGGCVLCVI